MQKSESDWAPPDGEIGSYVHLQSETCLQTYSYNPTLIDEHANIELSTAQGGYGRRQIYELVQNGADALLGRDVGRITVVLTSDAMYCANEGDPIRLDGVKALLHSNLSVKRGQQIGRFGLGFKSVLAVTRRAEFYSRSGSFRFDAEYAATRIRETSDEAEHKERLPALRLAWPVDAVGERDGDPVLDELMDWATTVVKLPRDPQSSSWLSEDLATFPPEFLVFSPHVGVLELDDRSVGTYREVRLTQSGDEYRITSPGGDSSWKVFSAQYTPTKQGLADAGELARREDVPIVWAVPFGRAGVGRFWAFFPTEYETTLSGILNAPWKTNEDRQNLLTGDFNDELLEAAAALVVEHLADLSDEEDPARHLDLMPARGREPRNWADERITDAVYQHAAGVRSLPDQNGSLRRPDELQLHPDDLPMQALDEWASYPGRPTDWCHRSVDKSRERRPRALRLIEAVQKTAATTTAWLEALVEDGSAGASAAALQVAGSIAASATPQRFQEVSRSRIVLSQDGRMYPADPTRVFLPGRDAVHESDITFVHVDVVASPEAAAGLASLRITTVDPTAEFQTMLAEGTGGWSGARWISFWELARLIEPDRAAEVITQGLTSKVTDAGGYHQRSANDVGNAIRVRTLDGSFSPANLALLPGAIVPADGSRDSSVAVDTEFHSDDKELLHSLGIVTSPDEASAYEDEPWFVDYYKAAVRAYLADIPDERSSPNPAYLEFDTGRYSGPLAPLTELSDEGRAAFTSAMLNSMSSPDPWTLAHRTQRANYPIFPFRSPMLWMAQTHGALQTSRGIRQVAESLGPGLTEWAPFLPIAECSERASAWLELPSSEDKIPVATWSSALRDEVARIDDDRALGRLYGAAAKYVPPPERLRSRVGHEHRDVAPNGVLVTNDVHEFEALCAEDEPVVLVETPAAAARLIELWDLRPAEDRVRSTIERVPSAEAVLIVDEFPLLALHLGDEQHGLDMVRCSTIRREVYTDGGRTADELDVALDSTAVYVSDQLDPAELLGAMLGELGLNLEPKLIEDVLDSRERDQERQIVVAVREQDTRPLKLVEAVGTDHIRRQLPRGLLSAVEQSHQGLDDESLGKLALAVYGVGALEAFKVRLEERGLQPPGRWAGSLDAVAFVRELGFPRSFAGTREARRDPVLDVEGPVELPELHDFQRTIADDIKALVLRDEDRRALVALPTGSGKTRIAVQAIVEAIRDDQLAGPVVWVADRDELCEQAVAVWADIWRSMGPKGQLQISRLWGANAAAAADDSSQVVVASFQKLRGCVGDPRYDWLTEASCVIVDEAHQSIGPAYTQILQWLGLGRSQRRDRCALVGLTATPYRGGEEETKRLVGRYGGRRLDKRALGDDPYAVLQEMGVLANADTQMLPGDEIDLTEEELVSLERSRLLPHRAATKLGESVRRNRTLLNHISELPQDWPVILFATSVEHAQTMAALLTLADIPAAAISAETPPATRRDYIEEFRGGGIRVLTNHGVLAQGFDAPSVRAVYIARPTYSPNLYQQMVGRGLRGPLNGGKERCLIVNVEDNVREFGEKLAFYAFDYLWSGPGRSDD